METNCFTTGQNCKSEAVGRKSDDFWKDKISSWTGGFNPEPLAGIVGPPSRLWYQTTRWRVLSKLWARNIHIKSTNENQRENKKPASIGSRTPDQRGRRFIGSQYIYFYNLYRMYLIYKGYLLLISHFLFSWVSEANLPYGLAMFIKWSSWHYAVQWYYLPLPICPSPITPPHLPIPSAYTICLYHLMIANPQAWGLRLCMFSFAQKLLCASADTICPSPSTPPFLWYQLLKTKIKNKLMRWVRGSGGWKSQSILYKLIII